MAIHSSIVTEPEKQSSSSEQAPVLRGALLAILRDSILVALACAFALTLAFQVRSPVLVDVGGKFDRPFIARLQDAENDGAQTYRWTRAESRVELEGIHLAAPWKLLLRANGYRPNRPARVALAVNGAPVAAFDAGDGWREYAFDAAVPADAWSGDSYLTIANDTFVPQDEIEGSRDGRTLGIAVDWVWFAPTRSATAIGNDDYWVELGALQTPPWGVVLSWALAFGLLYGTARGIGLPRRPVNAAFAVVVVLAALGFAFVRPHLGHYTGALLAIAAALALLALLFSLVIPRLYARLGITLGGVEWGALCGIALLSIGLKWGGAWYGQFRSSDLLFHAHRLEFVAQGNLFFTSQLPDPAQRVVPYPPALYVFLAPFAPFTNDYSSLLLIANPLADAAALFAVYYAARRLVAGGAHAALLAALLFAFNPVSFWIYSWGNHTNVFGQAAATLLFVLLLTHSPLRPRVLLFALFLFVAAASAHLGVFLSLLVFLPLGALLTLVGRSPGARRAALALMLLWAVGALLAWALYYGEFWNVLVQQTMRFIADFRAGQALGANAVPFSERAENVMRYTVEQVGWVLLAAGIVGVPLIWRALRGHARGLYVAWLLVALAFAVVTLGAAFSTRYTLWAAPALALSGGLALMRLSARSRAGVLAAYALCALAFAQTLALWVERVLFAYH